MKEWKSTEQKVGHRDFPLGGEGERHMNHLNSEREGTLECGILPRACVCNFSPPWALRKHDPEATREIGQLENSLQGVFTEKKFYDNGHVFHKNQILFYHASWRLLFLYPLKIKVGQMFS